MFLVRCIRKRCEQRQLAQETNRREAESHAQCQKQDREAESHAQRQKQDCEAEDHAQRQKQDREQARTMDIALRELQRTMDPVIAVQVYNNRFCLLTRLPEELLLEILDCLGDDLLTLYSLRLASRIFMRLIPYVTILDIEPVRSIRGGQPTLLSEFERRLQADGRCENCRRWSIFQERHLKRRCRFGRDFDPFSMSRGGPCCKACNIDHDDIGQSLLGHQQRLGSLSQGKSPCLAQRGLVTLCEHIKISWASIEAHINDWKRRQQQHGEAAAEYRQACLDSFRIECHDPSHDTRCAVSEPPTWPRACLRASSGVFDLYADIVVLHLGWAPHARINALAPTADGRIPASRLRALFRRLRQLGPADTIFPPYYADSLPEMACFGPRFPIYYKMGDTEEEKQDANKIQPPTPPALLPLPQSDHRMFRQYFHRVEAAPNGMNARRLSISPHFLSESGCTGIASQCLEVNYGREIMICHLEDLTNPAVGLTPTGPWLHAMDPSTYNQDELGRVRPLCKDESCVEYYPRYIGFCLC